MAQMHYDLAEKLCIVRSSFIFVATGFTWCPTETLRIGVTGLNVLWTYSRFLSGTLYSRLRSLRSAWLVQLHTAALSWRGVYDRVRPTSIFQHHNHRLHSIPSCRPNALFSAQHDSKRWNCWFTSHVVASFYFLPIWLLSCGEDAPLPPFQAIRRSLTSAHDLEGSSQYW